MFCSRLQSVVQKSFGLPQLATVNGNFTTFLLFVDDLFFYYFFLGGLVLKSHLKCPVQFFGSSVHINGLATFGWCSTEKPALFTRPSHVLDRVSSFDFVPFLPPGGHPVGYSKC